MTIQDNTVIEPMPSDDLLIEREKKWRLVLPQDYKDFISKFNGGIPNEKEFVYNTKTYVITRFLCIIKDVQNDQNGWYDIGVVESQIGERLTDNEDLIGIEVLPIAELFGGDYICLDFRKDKVNPCVCVWSNEESGEFEPATYDIAGSFSEFIRMLGT